MADTIVRCAKCVLSARYPGISFSPDGICSFCKAADYDPAEKRSTVLGEIQTVVADALALDVRYHAIVAYSGGKDSSFSLLALVKDFGLRCLAVTIDNGFLSESTLKNCHTVCDALGVDHQLYRPSKKFMNAFLKSSADGSFQIFAAARRASAICNSCITLINTYILRTAFLNHSPIVAGGYIGGQLPSGTGVMQFDYDSLIAVRNRTESGYIAELGSEARNYIRIAEVGEASKAQVAIVNPLLGYAVSEEQIVERISTLGWHKPGDTGLNSSNCRLNDLGIALHLQRHGFHPYEGELADLVRTGLMTRDQALRKLEPPSVILVGALKAELGLEK